MKDHIDEGHARRDWMGLRAAMPPAPLSSAAGAVVLTLCDTEHRFVWQGDVTQLTFVLGSRFIPARQSRVRGIASLPLGDGTRCSRCRILQ